MNHLTFKWIVSRTRLSVSEDTAYDLLCSMRQDMRITMSDALRDIMTYEQRKRHLSRNIGGAWSSALMKQGATDEIHL